MRTKLKIKNNVCILRIDDVKLIAKNPYIQPVNPYIYNDKSDILYFSYDLILKQKTQKGKWKTIIKNYVTDFGIMPYVADAVSEILTFDVKQKGIVKYIEKEVNGYTLTSIDDYAAFYPFRIAGLLNEDGIEILKTIKSLDSFKNKNEPTSSEIYDLTIFMSDNNNSKNAKSVHFFGLEKEDLQNLIDFANSFMDIASQKAKEEVKDCLYNDTDDKDNYPKIIRDYLYKNYKIKEWEDVFLKLSTKEYVLEEFVDYILGNKNIENLECREWHDKERTMAELFETMKDYEAYLYIVDDNTD